MTIVLDGPVPRARAATVPGDAWTGGTKRSGTFTHGNSNGSSVFWAVLDWNDQETMTNDRETMTNDRETMANGQIHRVYWTSVIDHWPFPLHFVGPPETPEEPLELSLHFFGRLSDL